MCIGIPMQVVELCGSHARCRDHRDIEHEIDMMLVGEQPLGAWVLTFLNTAREVISEGQAFMTINAITALEQVMQQGGNANTADAQQSLDHLFSDLVNREPQLPDFLRTPPPIEEA